MLIDLSTAYGAGSTLKPMPEQNFALESEGLDQEGAWPQLQILSVDDSGIATPEVDGISFGNYWKIVPNTTNTTHSIRQEGISIPATGSASFLIRDGGYGGGFLFRIRSVVPAILAQLRFSIADGFSSVTGFSDQQALDLGGGDWLISARWEGLVDPADIFYFLRNGAGLESFSGNGTDGLLATGVHISRPNRRYVKTTDAPVP